MGSLLVSLVNFSADVIQGLLFIYIILSFFVPPYNSFRQSLDGIISPVLNPIRRRIPPTGMFDISPLVLFLLIILTESILVSLLTLIFMR